MNRSLLRLALRLTQKIKDRTETKIELQHIAPHSKLWYPNTQIFGDNRVYFLANLMDLLLLLLLMIKIYRSINNGSVGDDFGDSLLFCKHRILAVIHDLRNGIIEFC